MKNKPPYLVKFDVKRLPKEYVRVYARQGLHQDDVFVFLGELSNMPGHCVVVLLKTGKIFSCYHVEDFRVLSEEET